VLARLLRVVSPPNPALLRGNRLGCGDAERPQWIMTYRLDGGKRLVLEVHDKPTWSGDGACARYEYGLNDK
jgi:hypothetical protein